MGSTIQRLRRTPGRIARNVSVATRLALVVVLVALVSVVVTLLVGVDRASSLAEDEVKNQLSAVSAARADEVERYIGSLQRAIAAQALTPRPAQAIGEFVEVFAELDAEVPTARDRDAVTDYYRDVVAPELSEARDRTVRSPALIPVSNAAVTLQAEYVVPEPDSGVPSADVPGWTEIDQSLDIALREFAVRVGFDDFYLIEPDAYVVVYSTAKDIDFATSMRSGPHSGSQLAALIDNLADDPEIGDVAVRDFAPYAPAGDRPSAFVGSPLFVDGALAGFIAGRFEADVLTTIMTNDEAWGELGDSGDTYVVGADNRMRSDARLFLEDRAAFFEQVEAAGSATADDIRSMRFFDTTVLFLEIDYQRVADTFSGSTAVDVETDYLGDEVLSSSRVLDIEGLEWAAVADADLAEIRSPIADFTRNLLVAIAVFIVVVTFLAVRWADRLLEPLRVISIRLRTIRDGGDGVDRRELPEGSADEFVELADDIDSMMVTLHERSSRAQVRADERRALVRRMLPAAIAERAEAGDRDVVEQVPSATVAVVVLDGLGTLVSGGTPERARELLDRFVDEADDIAAERGLERVQLSGDAYVAACGVTRPYLDHAARTADFVLELSDMLRDLDPQRTLHVSAGIDVGPITVGLTGGARLVHDAWGSTVQAAADLARSARAGEILVSQDCRSNLPATYRFEPTDRDGISRLHGVNASAEAPA